MLIVITLILTSEFTYGQKSKKKKSYWDSCINN